MKNTGKTPVASQNDTARLRKFEKVSLGQYKSSCSENAQEIYNEIKLPKRATIGSAGYDFFAPYSFVLKPSETITIATGIRAFMPQNYVLMLFPRSGLGFKFRLQLNNTVGVVDSDYVNSQNEGHIFIRLYNDGDKVLEIEKGQGFAQGIFLQFGVTDDDDADGIRDGGFGSTTQ